MVIKTILTSDKFTFGDFVYYIRNPKFINISQKNDIVTNIKYLLKSYFFCLLLSVLAGLFLLSLDYLLVKYAGIKSIYHQIKENNTEVKKHFEGYAFLAIVFAAPFIEEIIFRLPLNLKKASIAFAISILFFRFSGNSLTYPDFTSTHYRISLLCASIVFVLISYFFPITILSKIKLNYFKWWYYFIVLTFGLVHISNIKHLNFNLALLYPIFVLPQMIIGAFIGDIRMHRGFIWGFALHGLINLISYFLR